MRDRVIRRRAGAGVPAGIVHASVAISVPPTPLQVTVISPRSTKPNSARWMLSEVTSAPLIARCRLAVC
jgi:hypothetical protein